MHEVLVNRLGGLSLPRKSVVRLTDRLDMTLDVYRGRKTTTQQQHSTLYLRHVLENGPQEEVPNDRQAVVVCDKPARPRGQASPIESDAMTSQLLFQKFEIYIHHKLLCHMISLLFNG